VPQVKPYGSEHKMECWSDGILEYWVSNPSLHHSITPVPMSDRSATKQVGLFQQFVEP
jgi:hypothetical protein